MPFPTFHWFDTASSFVAHIQTTTHTPCILLSFRPIWRRCAECHTIRYFIVILTLPIDIPICTRYFIMLLNSFATNFITASTHRFKRTLRVIRCSFITFRTRMLGFLARNNLLNHRSYATFVECAFRISCKTSSQILCTFI